MNDNEVSLIGAASMYPGVTTEQALDGSQFEDMRLGALWDAIRVLAREGRRADPAALLDVDPKVDVQLFTDCLGSGVSANADLYADRVRDDCFRRELDGALLRARQALGEGHPVDEVLSGVSRVRAPQADDFVVWDAVDFVNRPQPPIQWVIPGLLARSERLIVTGTEGVGKSHFLRQLAVCAAAGFHPFTGESADPRKVLYLDLENPERLMVAKFGEVMRPLHMTKPSPLKLVCYPRGVDLLKTPDRLRLRRAIECEKPDLVIGGPVYRMYVGGGSQREEDVARVVTSVLDELRAEFGFALVLECHAGHGQDGGGHRNLRPFGSSLWLRWPEFGLGLAMTDDYSQEQREVDVVHWRGDRDQRPWPFRLQSGGTMPWTEP